MVSTEKKFIFIHIPKTGGNSIQRMLLPYADDRLSVENPNQDGVQRFGIVNQYGLQKHATLVEYRAKLPRPLFDSCFIFSCIRNPWERAISYYFSPHRGNVSWDRCQFVECLKEMRPVSDYLGGVTASNIQRLDGIDFVIRFENLDPDFERLCEILNIKRKMLPRINASNRAPYEAYYDAELIKKVESLFSEEILLGGYTFGDG